MKKQNKENWESVTLGEDKDEVGFEVNLPIKSLPPMVLLLGSRVASHCHTGVLARMVSISIFKLLPHYEWLYFEALP